MHLHFGQTGFLGLLLPPQNGLLQGMKFFFHHAVEQRVRPVVQSCIYFCPVFPLQGLHRTRKQQLFFLFQVLTLILDEVVHCKMKVFPQKFLVRENIVDDVSKAAQPPGFNFVLGLHVTEASCCSNVSGLQFPEDHLFLRVMAIFGVVLKILDDRLQDLIIRSLAAIEYLKFVLQNEKQFSRYFDAP